MTRFTTPILLLVFNRPEHVHRLINVLKPLHPKELYISCDGPRSGNLNDVKHIKKIRRVIEREVSWECNVHTLFSKTNGGCKLGVSQGITWFFNNVEAGIILEDDCVPHPTFFKYCEILLDKYKDQENVFSIMGTNLLQKRFSSDSYVFTPHVFCWGWATWRRAWQHFDLHMNDWPKMKKENALSSIFIEQSAIDYWANIFDRTMNDEIDTWAFRWTYSSFKNNALNIMPNVNMITNEGFGFDKKATHTKFTHAKYSVVPKKAVKFPLKHPSEVAINHSRALYIHKTLYQENYLAYLWNLLYGTAKYFFKQITNK